MGSQNIGMVAGKIMEYAKVTLQNSVTNLICEMLETRPCRVHLIRILNIPNENLYKLLLNK